MNEDTELLRRYVHEHAEDAFAELVQRQLNFVYSVALRRLGGDAHLAEDVAQQVFCAAAQNADALVRHPAFSAWLFTTTRNLAARAVRTTQRRRIREQEAYSMNDANNTDAQDWARIRPALEDVLDDLRDAERQAVVLRYFEGQSFAEVGRRLRLTENGARMRVERALDKLHAALGRRGVNSTTAAVAAILATPALISAPTGLAATISGAALAGAAGGGALAGGGLATALSFMSMTTMQSAVAAAIAAASITGYVLQGQNHAELREEIGSLQVRQNEMVVLRQESEQLARAAAEAVDLQRDDLELARLRDEAEALRMQQQTIARGDGNPRANPSVSYNLSQLDQIPQAVVRVPPTYPPEMKQVGASGEVVVEFVVDVNGAVQNATAVKSSRHEFEESAVEAVRNWVFQPGRKGQESVNARVQLPIVFTLNTAAAPAPAVPSAQKKAPDRTRWF